VVFNGNGKAALIKEYGNLGMGFVVCGMLMFVIWRGTEMGRTYLDSQVKMFEQMVENQKIELEQDKKHHEQMKSHNEHSREILGRMTIGASK